MVKGLGVFKVKNIKEKVDENIKKCSNANCSLGGKINLKRDKYIYWKNSDGKKLIEEHWFHHFCWGQFIQGEVNKGISLIMNNTMSTLAPMINNLKEMMA